MEKKVYCYFGQRCKCVKFESKEGEFDTKILNEKLKQICAQDVLLSVERQNKTPVLQMKDPDRDIWCDVDDDIQIPDKSDINVIFVPSTQLISSSVITSDNVLLSPVSTESINNSSEVRILYTEPVLEVPSNNEDQEKVDEKEHDTLEINSATSCEETYKPGPSKSSTTANSTIGSGVILLSTPLPPLTFDLEKKVKNQGVFASQKDLIYHWGMYLWDKTAGAPSKNDYQNLAINIVNTYPELGSKESGSSIVRTTLSSWIRNHRSIIKKQAVKRTASGKILKGASNAAVLTDKESQFDVENSLKELDKNKVDKNTPHIRRLLKVTLTERRKWIENEAKSMSDIIDKYPQLKNNNLLIFEFFNFKNLTENDVWKKIDVMMDKLSRVFEVTIENNEKCKTSIIEQLHNQLTKKLKKNEQPLFLVKEAGSCTKDLVTFEGQSPRCISFMAGNGIATAFIVADKSVEIEIEEPSVKKILTSILTTYYVFHIEFPKPYRHFLQYLDFEIAGTSIDKKNQVLLKFLRQIDAVLLKNPLETSENVFVRED